MFYKGFTLVELLIVFAIIAILVMFAFPAYLDYTIRTRVADGLHYADGAKVAVSETTLSNNTLPATQAATGFVSPPATDNVASITVGANGTITITYTAIAGGGTVILTPTLVPDQDLTWDCTGGTMLPKYRPGSCRP